MATLILKKSDRYTEKLITLTKEINSLLFVDAVVSECNNILLNEDIEKNLIDITTFIKRQGFENHPKRTVFVRFASRRLNVIRIPIINQHGLPSTHRRKLHVDKKQLQVLFDNYDWKSSKA